MALDFNPSSSIIEVMLSMPASKKIRLASGDNLGIVLPNPMETIPRTIVPVDSATIGTWLSSCQLTRAKIVPTIIKPIPIEVKLVWILFIV